MYTDWMSMNSSGVEIISIHSCTKKKVVKVVDWLDY